MTDLADLSDRREVLLKRVGALQSQRDQAKRELEVAMAELSSSFGVDSLDAARALRDESEKLMEEGIQTVSDLLTELESG